MRTVTATEFAKRPGRYMDDASRGETLVIVRYGRPYCLLTPPPADKPEPTQETKAG
jgi:antitoxin (DNA-binding transcriptional repressor) of toxin-antitoxin stability system